MGPAAHTPLLFDSFAASLECSYLGLLHRYIRKIQLPAGDFRFRPATSGSRKKLKGIAMSNLNLTKLEWNTVPDNSIGGNGAPRRTNLRVAQAICGACGLSWRANATTHPTGALGEIFEYVGGMAVDCPSCKKKLKLDGAEYKQLYS